MKYAVMVSDRSENTIIPALKGLDYTKYSEGEDCFYNTDVVIAYGDRLPQLNFILNMKERYPHVKIVHVHAYDETSYNGYKYVDEYTRQAIRSIADYALDCRIDVSLSEHDYCMSPKLQCALMAQPIHIGKYIIVMYKEYNKSRTLIEMQMIKKILALFCPMKVMTIDEDLQSYFEFIKSAHCVIGNSTAVTIDAPCCNTPSINVGWRNYKRTNLPSIIYVPEPLTKYSFKFKKNKPFEPKITLAEWLKKTFEVQYD